MANPQAKTIRAKKLGVLIRDARLVTGKTRKESAEAIGVTSGILAAYERGARSPSLPELEVLTYYLGVPLAHFWGQEALSEKPARTDSLEVERLIVIRQAQIAEGLKSARGEAGRSIKELAEEVGIPAGRLSAYEGGKKPVPLPELEALVSSLGGSLPEFYDRESEVGGWLAEKDAVDKFLELPPGLQSFVCKPINRPFLELAQRLSEMPVEKLRSVAEGLLEITL